MVVERVCSEPVSPDFPVKQGKYREFFQFWARIRSIFGGIPTNSKALKNFIQKRNREKQGINREISPDFSHSRWAIFRREIQPFFPPELVIRHAHPGIQLYPARPAKISARSFTGSCIDASSSIRAMSLSRRSPSTGPASE